MRSVPVRAFLSCSFDAVDKDVVEFFACIARGMDIQCTNVDKGYVLTPPQKANEMIAAAHTLIAVATKRIVTATGGYLMPQAVEEEMAMAFAHNKPILLFVEKGVDTSGGFARNYTTFLEFDRGDLKTPAFLERVVHSIHEAKCGTLLARDADIEQQGQQHVYADKNHALVELVETATGFTWRYSLTKRFKFTESFSDPLMTGAWASVPALLSATAPDIKWSYAYRDGTRPFKLTATAEVVTPTKCELAFAVDPHPEAGDEIEFSTFFESPYLTPMYEDDVAEKTRGVLIAGKKYITCEGSVPIQRTRELLFQIRIPRSYGLTASDFKPFAGSYTNKVDYVVLSEMQRMVSDVQDFGGTIVITLKTESPLHGHLYGVAWNPPKGKTK